MSQAETIVALRELARLWKGNIRSAPRAAEELAAREVTLPRWVKGRQPDEQMSLAVCMPYDLDHPLYYPDNRRDRCTGCRRVIQFRPSLPKTPERLCPFCALRRARGDA
jgi:hypothetical protein